MRTGPKTERLTILRAATLETELGDHDFYLSRSHYTDTDPTSKERAVNGQRLKMSNIKAKSQENILLSMTFTSISLFNLHEMKEKGEKGSPGRMNRAGSKRQGLKSSRR